MTPEYLVGRRFECKGEPDVTCVSFVPNKGIRLHGLDGRRHWMALPVVVALVKNGTLVESETGVPFVLERLDARGEAHRRRAALYSGKVVSLAGHRRTHRKGR